MRLTQSVVPRASAFLLILVPSLLFGSANWIVDAQFAWSDEARFLALLGPMCLLAIWCALGRTNVWLRFAIIALICSAWTYWIDNFGPVDNDITVPYFIGIFATFALPLCLLRLIGFSIQLTNQSVPIDASQTSGQGQVGVPRFSVGNLFQIVTLGAILMAVDRLCGFSQEVDREEIVIGAAIAVVAALVSWLSLGTRRLWLRLLAWLTIPAIIYLPCDQDWDVIYLVWLGMSAALSVELLGFRRLGYRLVWGVVPVQHVAENPISWGTIWRSAATVVAIAVYVLLLGKCVSWSQALTAPWRIDGMATLGAYITVNLQTPIFLLAIWCVLSSASLTIRLATTAIGGILLTIYFVVAEPFGQQLPVEPQVIAQQLLATIIPLFALRPFGFTIRKPREVLDAATPQTWRPQITLKNAFIMTTAAALLMGVHHWTSLFQGQFESSVLRGFLFANLVIVTLVYACLDGTRWWLRVIPLLICCQLCIGLLSEFPVRNAAWVASMSVTVGGVLLAFRLRGFRLMRLQSSPATTPVLDPLNSLAAATNSLSLAAGK